MITLLIRSVVLVISIFGAGLDWWSGWVILLTSLAMIEVGKKGE